MKFWWEVVMRKGFGHQNLPIYIFELPDYYVNILFFLLGQEEREKINNDNENKVSTLLFL